MSRARILLVEDDPSITRFVCMALEVFDADIVHCTDVPSALQALRAAPVRLIITDLMLPGESGADLVQRLADDPTLAPHTPVAVYSAGLTAAVREQLQALGVWRILAKPTPLDDLERCARDALALPVHGHRHGTWDACHDLNPAEQHAIATHFAGNTALYLAYRSSCQQQFSTDVRTGDAAVAAQDWPALRRLTHSLATVLLSLGRPDDSTLARQTEDAAAAVDVTASQTGWNALRERL